MHAEVCTLLNAQTRQRQYNTLELINVLLVFIKLLPPKRKKLQYKFLLIINLEFCLLKYL